MTCAHSRFRRSEALSAVPLVTSVHACRHLDVHVCTWRPSPRTPPSLPQPPQPPDHHRVRHQRLGSVDERVEHLRVPDAGHPQFLARSSLLRGRPLPPGLFELEGHVLAHGQLGHAADARCHHRHPQPAARPPQRSPTPRSPASRVAATAPSTRVARCRRATVRRRSRRATRRRSALRRWVGRRAGRRGGRGAQVARGWAARAQARGCYRRRSRHQLASSEHPTQNVTANAASATTWVRVTGSECTKRPLPHEATGGVGEGRSGLGDSGLS